MRLILVYQLSCGDFSEYMGRIFSLKVDKIKSRVRTQCAAYKVKKDESYADTLSIGKNTFS